MNSKDLIDEKAEYTKDRPMDNIPANLLGKLARIVVEIEQGTDRLGNHDWVLIRSLIYDVEIQRWLADLERLAYLPIRKVSA